MSEHNVCRIIGAASAGVAGIGVRFDTIFLEQGRVGGSRVYENFKNNKQQLQSRISSSFHIFKA